MSDEVKMVRVQIRAPKGFFAGEIAEGWYCVVDGCLVMTDAEGKPVDSEKHHLNPGDDARLLACRLVRQRRSVWLSMKQLGSEGADIRVQSPRLFKEEP